MHNLFIAVAEPTSPLASDWAVYIIGLLVAAVIALAVFIRSIFIAVKQGVIAGWGEVKSMHNEAMVELKESNERGRANDSSLETVKIDIKETKYAIQELKSNIKCKESSK